MEFPRLTTADGMAFANVPLYRQPAYATIYFHTALRRVADLERAIRPGASRPMAGRSRPTT